MKTRTLVSKTCFIIGVSALVLSLGACADKTKGTGPSASGSAAASVDGPRIEVGEGVHDFGTVTEGETVKHTFTIKNTGSAPLIIENVRSSCGCTAVVTKDKEVAPGGSTELDVAFNTRGRMGQNSKTITIQSNDKDNPNAKLEIKAMIEQLLTFQPMIIRLNASHGETRTVEAWLLGKLAKDAKLELGEITGDTGVKIELAEKKDGDETVHGLRFTLEGKKVGRDNGTVKVKTGVEKVPELTLRFDTTVIGNIQLRPRALYFDTQSPQGKSRVVSISSKRDDFKVNSAKVAQGPYEAKVKKPEKGGGFQVEVTLKATENDEKNKDADLNGKLEIMSNDPLEPKVEVPLHVRRIPNLMRARPDLPMAPQRVDRKALKPQEPTK